MSISFFGIVSYSDVAFFGFFILIVFLLLIAVCLFGYWVFKQKDSLSPYTGTPLRRGADIPYYGAECVLRFLYELHQYDNRMFDLRYAGVCRDTGRIFPDALTWYDRIKVDWNFLQKRYPGNFVSWGSLNDIQKEAIRAMHHSMEGFQTEFSCPIPSPRLIEKEYALYKPGPLYVDLETKVLLGWKCVPDTNFEVMIVQKPKGIFETQKI